MAPFSAYVIAIVMFAVSALIAWSLIAAIDHFDGSDAERPKH